jgi:hypothetical protein
MNSHVANTESLAFVRNVRMTFSQHHCGKENSMTQIQYLLNEVARRMKAKGTPDFYKPFTEEESRLLREHYASQFQSLAGDDDHFILTRDTRVPLAMSYERIVVGDYGPFVEIRPSEANMDMLRYHFGSAPRRPVSYIWLDLVGEDGIVSQAKIYYQQKTVQYADYRPEMLYVSPHQVTKVRKLSQEVAA